MLFKKMPQTYDIQLDTLILPLSLILYSRFRKIQRINTGTEQRVKLIIHNLLPKARIQKWYQMGKKSLNLASDVISQGKNIFT